MIASSNRRALALLAAFATAAPSLRAGHAEGGWWREDFAAAKAEAQDAGVPLVVFFTGSDWCIWCQKLEAELFAANAFRAAAGKHFVPVRLDFPHRTALPVRLQRQNRQLQHRFAVEAFPTVLWLCPWTEAVLHRHGYLEVSAEAWLEALGRVGGFSSRETSPRGSSSSKLASPDEPDGKVPEERAPLLDNAAERPTLQACPVQSLFLLLLLHSRAVRPFVRSPSGASPSRP